MNFREELKKNVLIFDGGMGSLLQAEGLKAGELPETWNLRHPEVIRQIHEDYLRAGAEIIKTNTFGANGLKYAADGEFSLEAVVTAAMENARAAVKAAGHGMIALDLGPTGRLLAPMGDLEFEDCVKLYAEVVRIGKAHGADLILIETMSDLYELKAAVLAAKENSDLLVVATVIFDATGKLLTGGTPESAVAVLEGLRVDALGMNCGLGPKQMRPFIRRMIAASSTPVVINPNAGLPHTENGRTVYDIGPEEFAGEMAKILEDGVSLAGGCCGTTPEYIRRLHDLAAGRKAPEITKKHDTVVTSFAGAVRIGDDPVIIGERINPTGKKRFKQALREHDTEYILQQGIAQQDAGAQILDVNVGLPGMDEAAMMTDVIRELQGVTELPLQIDTSDRRAMEQAMRIYNGKPLINSVNGKKESMDAVFPLVARYGGVVVALALDEDGIPADADGRIRVARKIIAEAETYGIDRKDILIDALCLTVSSEERGALVTLETVRRVREELGCGTVLGVSNMSFGLPQREIINAAFFTMAMQSGLSAGIINPNNDAMMRSYRAFRALTARDPHCGDYIAAYSNYEPPVPKGYVKAGSQEALRAAGSAGNPGDPGREGAGAAGASSDENGQPDGLSLPGAMADLALAVEKGLKEQAGRAAELALETAQPLDVVNQCMIPALDLVGKKFEKGTLYLPQLLMSADAAKAAFEIIKSRMAGSGASREKKGKIIIATVRGDIHDIGKNIDKVLLENYSFDVIDLGRDVPPEKIVETALRENVRLVGLSALMTTTVPSMEETIRELRAKAPGVKVWVGGAVMTADYAEEIGADAYCRDAMSSVEYAKKILG